MAICLTFWGTHGCDLDRGHDTTTPHLCAGDEDGPCSEHDGQRVRYFEYIVEEGQPIRQKGWSDWYPSPDGTFT